MRQSTSTYSYRKGERKATEQVKSGVVKSNSPPKRKVAVLIKAARETEKKEMPDSKPPTPTSKASSEISPLNTNSVSAKEYRQEKKVKTEWKSLDVPKQHNLRRCHLPVAKPGKVAKKKKTDLSLKVPVPRDPPN